MKNITKIAAAVSLLAAAPVIAQANNPITNGDWLPMNEASSADGSDSLWLVSKSGGYLTAEGFHNVWITVINDKAHRTGGYGHRFLLRINCEARQSQITQMQMIDETDHLLGDTYNNEWGVPSPGTMIYSIASIACGWDKK